MTDDVSYMKARPNNVERSIWNLYCKDDDFMNEQLK